MRALNWKEYVDYMQEIVNGHYTQPPYDKPDYHHYTKMNEVRQRRWLKANPLTQETVAAIKQINTPQQWVVITEPWCGDAAHIVPIIYLMSTLNNKITLWFQLRDSGSEIDKYLTNGSRSIPILIVRNAEGDELFYWGPRPKQGQELYLSLAARKASLDEMIVTLQNYYNADKSLSIQQEIVSLLSAHLQ